MNPLGSKEAENKTPVANDLKQKRQQVLESWNDVYLNEYSMNPTDYKLKIEIVAKQALRLIDELYDAYNTKPEPNPQPAAKEVEQTNPGFAKLLKKLEQDHEQSDRNAYDAMLARLR